MKGELARSAAQPMNPVGSQIGQRSINVQPTLEIRPGQCFAITDLRILCTMHALAGQTIKSFTWYPRELKS